MTPDAIRRVQTSYQQLGDRGDALATAFYAALFGRAPQLRRVFPDDMTSLKGHFDAALALIIRNLDSLGALEPAIRDLGAQHVHWGARPEDYAIARDALVTALRELSGSSWTDDMEHDWREAITVISVAMLHGAAVETAVFAERLTDREA
jgi:hemoglobin-like flavoprotein